MTVSVFELFYYRMNYLDVCGRRKNYKDKSLSSDPSELAGLIDQSSNKSLVGIEMAKRNSTGHITPPEPRAGTNWE
jgi:hypothetical protein